MDRVKAKQTEAPLVCIKCGKASVTVFCTADGGRNESASYGARCDAGCGIVADDMPTNCDGRKSSAIAEYKRVLKRQGAPACTPSTPVAAPVAKATKPTKPELARDVYVRIMLASTTGRGVHLSAEDVQKLALDDAIYSAADMYLDRYGYMLSSDGIVSNHRT